MQQLTAKWYIVLLAALLQLLTAKALPLLCDKDCNAKGVWHYRIRTALVWCCVVRVVGALWCVVQFGVNCGVLWCVV